MASSRRQRLRPKSQTLGELPIPDYRFWPKDIQNWYRSLTSDRGSLDVYIFECGTVARIILQDAITALSLLGSDNAEWQTEKGYPEFIFSTTRLGAVCRTLQAAGYTVRRFRSDGVETLPKNRGKNVFCITGKQPGVGKKVS